MNNETINFKNQGVVVIRSVFSRTEISVLASELDNILNNSSGLSSIVKYRTFPWKENLPERIDPISAHSNVFQNLISDERITSRVQQFFNEKTRYFKDKIIFKAPDQSGYEAHQDQSWWTKLCNKAITCLIAIDEANETNGGLEFLLNAHGKLLTNPEEPRFLNAADLKKFENNTWYLPLLHVGDVVFFDSLTIHKSAPNHSANWRRSYFISYCN